MIFSVGRADVTAEITSVRQFFTFSVMPSLSIMIICACVKGRSHRSVQLCSMREWGRGRTYAPASMNFLARSMSHLGSRVPADSSSSTEASPPAPHLVIMRGSQ